MNVIETTKAAVIACLLLSGGTANADPLHGGRLPALSPSDIEQLGIVFATPTPVAGGQSLRLPATVTVPPNARELVSAPCSGLVLKTHHALGERVQAGAKLVDLRSAELVALESALRRARATYALARRNLDRDELLAAEGAIPGRRLDATRTEYETARIEFEATRSRLMAIGVNVEGLGHRHGSASPKDTLSVAATIDGVVVQKFAEIGERVEAMAPLYRLANPGRLWIEARIPVEHAGRLRRGDILGVDTSDGVTVSGAITLIGGVVDAATDTVLVRAELPPGSQGLLPGQFVMARWFDGGTEGLEVPADAVVRIRGQDYVFVRRQDGLEAVGVALGMRDTNTVRIVSGLEASDRIVVSGAAQLKALWPAGSESR